jgi:hypothetical protein
MNRALTAESLAQLTAFERFLILNKRKLMWLSFFGAFIFTVLFMPQGHGGIRMAKQSARMQTARSIGISLFTYSNDHDGKYPVGKSSTEVFQQLIDQQYVSDPSVFYFDMPGKTKPTSNTLKPENVCYDVTNAVQDDDPDYLPVVFSTGYKIDYVKDGKAHLLANGDPAGIAIFYKSNSAFFRVPRPDGISVEPPSYDPNVKYDFNSKGRTYLQLTPDGPLP